MGVFCEGLKLGSTAALDFLTVQNKGRYHEKELSNAPQLKRALITMYLSCWCYLFY